MLRCDGKIVELPRAIKNKRHVGKSEIAVIAAGVLAVEVHHALRDCNCERASVALFPVEG